MYFKAKTITTANGLSDNRVTCFHKDRKGFMWIGTRNGLNRYDGHSFTLFRPAAGNSISNEVINDIAEDSHGRIWVATMEGLNIYNPATNTWECMRPDTDRSQHSIPNFIIWDIEIDKQDRVLIAPDVFEFCQYDIRTKKFIFYDWPAFARSQPVLKAYGYRSIHKFIAKSDHELWLGATNGLVSLDLTDHTFRFHGGGYAGDVIDLRYDAENKQVFLSAEKGKLFRYDEQADGFTEIVAEPEPYPSSRFTFPGQNEIWMASQTGLIKISDDRKKVALEKNIPQLSGSVLQGGTRRVFEDNNHIRWVGTTNGISIYDPSVSASAFLPLLPVSDKEGSNVMAGVYYDEISACYFVCAIEPAAVFIIHSMTGEIKKITTDAAGKKLSFCTGIKPDQDNNLWLLTGTEVYRYDRSTERFNLFAMPNKGALAAFRDMVGDAAGNYWFSTYNKGIYSYRQQEKTFRLLEDSFFNGGGSVTGLALDEINDKIIIGSFGEGVYIYDIRTGKNTGFQETDQTKDYSPLLLVNSVSKDKTGVIWLSTYSGGIFRYNPGMPFEKTFTRYDMRGGLSNNNILSCSRDDDSTLWLLSGKGLSAMSIHGKFLYDLDGEQTFNFSSW
ncbi:MAG TPA: two-component regulator propeller domain-containing protein, partial [Chitinophagaceae bacterium]|nr:two-component regulator propeller domain-containing protein [Chitinophagaceae bacterium]